MHYERACLIVDDEQEILDSVRRICRNEDFTVYTAKSPAEGLELLRNHDIQVVLSDQRMPETSGIEFLAMLRSQYPDIVRVLITSYSNVEHFVDAINKGHVYRYVSKPWDPHELRIILRQCFERWEGRAERSTLMKELEQRNQELLQKNEELKTLDRVKNVFMEVVSHELNTPTAVILGYAHLLRRELSDTENPVVSKAVEGIDHGGKRLKNIAHRMFQLVDDETTSPLDVEEINLKEFLDALHQEVGPFLQRRGQTLHVSCDDDAVVTADRGKLQDILVNLVMNAIKFSPDDYTITLDAEVTSQHVVFSVTDDGIGINEADLDQIFHPFFSTFDSKYHSSGDFEFGKRGMGLGLSIARRFAEMHGGKIEALSIDDNGTRFVVTLPKSPFGHVA